MEHTILILSSEQLISIECQCSNKDPPKILNKVENPVYFHQNLKSFRLHENGYTNLGVIKPRSNYTEDFNFQELDVQWREDFLWVQTKFSRFCQIYAFPSDKNGVLRKQVKIKKVYGRNFGQYHVDSMLIKGFILRN